jgi:membrane protease subunit HflK
LLRSAWAASTPLFGRVDTQPGPTRRCLRKPYASQAYLDRNPGGVEIVGVKLQDMHPPLEVVSSFRDVASAREDRITMINEAQAYANEVVPVARGDAEKQLRQAEGYRRERIDRARGDADRIIAMARAYKEAPDVTRTRLYLETMEEILTGVEKFIVSADVQLRGYDIRVFDKDVGKAAAAGE